MPKMSPHVNSLEDLTSQQQAQSTQNQQVQPGNNQSTATGSAQLPQHTRKLFIDFHNAVTQPSEQLTNVSSALSFFSIFFIFRWVPHHSFFI